MSKPLPYVHPNCQPYNWALYQVNHSFLERLKDRIKGRLYDLGCGEMSYRTWFLQYAASYTGVDWGETPHELKADVLADLNKGLPIDDAAADTVVSLSVMEHLHDPEMFLREAHRILVPGGSMILQVPFMWWVHEAPYDYFRYTRYGLEHLFKRAGFSDVEVFPQTGFWLMWTLKLNYQCLQLIRGPEPLRKIIRGLLRCFWAIDQRIALFLDRYWKAEGETAGYFAVGLKS